MNFNDLSKDMTADTYQALKTALELSKWENGSKVTKDQQSLIMEAIILWEQKNVSEEQRTGFIEHAGCASKGIEKEIINLTDILDG
jgi:uncharacterized protein